MTRSGVISGQLRRDFRVASLLKQFGNLSRQTFSFEEGHGFAGLFVLCWLWALAVSLVSNLSWKNGFTGALISLLLVVASTFGDLSETFVVGEFT